MMGNVVTLPNEPVARIRLRLSMCRDHDALNACGDDFKRIRHTLPWEEALDFAKKFAVQHMQISMAQLAERKA